MTLPMETERLTLRLFDFDDAEEYLKIASQPKVMWGHAIDEVPTIDVIKEGIEKRTESWNKLGFCRSAVIVKETGQLIGSVGLAVIPDTDNVVEVVWTITDDETRNGYATEAAKAWLRYGLEDLGLKMIVALANPENVASIRVMEKLGLEKVGIQDTYYGRDLMVYHADRAWLKAVHA